MATVHTEYGPGRIIDQETVRGRTRYKVAGEGFEVWIDQTKVGGIVPESLRGVPTDLDDYGYGEEPGYFPGEEIDDNLLRHRLRRHEDVDGYDSDFGEDDPARYSSRRTAAGGPDHYIEDDPYGDNDFVDVHRLRNKLRVDDERDDDDPARYSSRMASWDTDDDDFGGDPRGRVDDLHDLRRKLRIDDEREDDDPARYSRRMRAGWEEDRFHDIMNDDPYREYEDEDAVGDLAREYGLDRRRDFDDDPEGRYAGRVVPGKGGRLAWAPLDRDNSTTLPYDPEPQHHAIGTPGDDDSSTIQPIHNVDPDERLSPSNSISFDGEDGGVEPGPNPDLFAKEGALDKEALFGLMMFEENRNRLRKALHKTLGKQRGEVAFRGLEGHVIGGSYQNLAQGMDNQASQAANWASPGGPFGGYGNMIRSSGVHLSGPEMALIAPILRTLAPAAISTLMGGGGAGGAIEDAMGEGADFGPGEGYGDMIHDANYRPAGLSDKYIDLTAAFDPTDPVSQFRHDPDAYINRVGHLGDEGLNPRFAEYMDLVEADGSIRTAAWKDVRKKAMRLKREGNVTVKDIGPNRIMASVIGDHGTYDVVILKNGGFTGLNEGAPGHSISNWHCGCEWGKWAFRRKYTYVGRLCSHAYASYLTMQSEHMKGKPRQQKLPRTKKPTRNMFFPSTNMRHADALQNGPERLTPELVVNDTDDAHTFVDVTKDEREDTGPDAVVSDRDIVHFARVMEACERNEQPYPRELVAFLSRYSGAKDDAKGDWSAPDSGDADADLSKLRSLSDSKQSDDFGSMADRVHRIQDVVEDARENGADASQFVAMLRQAAGEDEQKLNPGAFPKGTQKQMLRDTFNPPATYNPEGPLNNGINFTQFSPDTQKQMIRDTFAPGGGAKNTGNQGPAGGAPKAPAAGGGGGAPASRPMTQGPVSDGGVAGAENGDNSAITKDMLDADGNYTVKGGETWTDIAQRTTGDMNNYQKMYDRNKGVAGPNVDNLAAGTKVNLKDFANDVGNGGVRGDVTNPGGSTKAMAGPAFDAANAPKADTPDAPKPADPAPAMQPADASKQSMLRRSNSGTGGGASNSNGQQTQPGDAQNPTNGQAAAPAQPQKPTATGQPVNTSPGAKPATNPATSPDKQDDTLDKNDPTQMVQQQQAAPGQQPAGMGAGSSGLNTPGMGMGDVGGMIGQGIGAAADIASGIGSAIPGIGGAISGIASGLGSIFASKEDFDEWARYAYPTADGEGDLEPHDHPFAGSGWPGPLDIGTSEEYADEARKGMDDVTDLEQHDVESSMDKWQKQGAAKPDGGREDREWAARTYGGEPDDYTRNEKGELVNGKGVGKEREASFDYATDDNSDIVRAFQANLGETALGAGAGGGSGRFDDISGAAQGFLRTAGRNYSLAEQSELIREGDKGGARNLGSLDLTGTHYEDMTTLGW